LGTFLALSLAVLEDRRQVPLKRAAGVQGAIDRGDERDRGGGFGALDLGEILGRIAPNLHYELLERQAVRRA
jgi:hypothetical protein